MIAHKSYVTSAVMQAVAGLEAIIWEVVQHGPGQHLGSNGIDPSQLQMLAPLSDLIGSADVLSRFTYVLHFLSKQSLNKSTAIWNNAKLLVGLRNELTHYKSSWGAELRGKNLMLGKLQAMNFDCPPWIPKEGTNFFPLQCLSAKCSAWAAGSSVAFVDEFYRLLQVPSPLEGHRQRLL